MRKFRLRPVTTFLHRAQHFHNSLVWAALVAPPHATTTDGDKPDKKLRLLEHPIRTVIDNHFMFLRIKSDISVGSREQLNQHKECDAVNNSPH